MSALSGKNRAEAWRERLQAFASNPPEEMGDEWGLLLDELGLTPAFYLAVCEVLKQGSWAKARHPRAYVKKAATIEARKMHLSVPLKDDTLECGNPRLVFIAGDALDKCTTREAIEGALEAENREHSKPSLPPMKGRHFVPEQWDEDGEYRIREEEIAENRPSLPNRFWIKHELPPAILTATEQFNLSHNDRHVHANPFYSPDWDKWGREAGLDSWQMKVIWYRKNGISRDIALSDQPDKKSRLELQAAFKRFERTGMKQLRECHQK
jgi:hypothetical protein